MLVWRRMYPCQASEPDSRPPPVSFSPPKAPPISAPDGPILTLAMPQSEPAAERKVSASRRSVVEDARGQALGHVVVHGDGVLQNVVCHNVENGGEGFRPYGIGLPRHFNERRGDVGAAGGNAFGHDFTAGYPAAFIAGPFERRHHGVPSVFVDQWANQHAGIPGGRRFRARHRRRRAGKRVRPAPCCER